MLVRWSQINCLLSSDPDSIQLGRPIFTPFTYLFAIIALATALSACTMQSFQPAPTTIPTEQLPTIIALTVQAAPQSTHEPSPTLVQVQTELEAATPTVRGIRTRTLTPTTLPSPTPTHTSTATASPTPTITPTITDTPRPEIPLSVIRINRPAPLSRVASPLEVRAVLPPGAGGIFRVELLGEDGRLLARQVLNYQGLRINLSIDLPFEIAAAAETGRLQIFINDVFGRITALSSTEVLLLSIGRSEYHPAGDQRDRILILQPVPEDLISGGVLTVFGKARPNEDEPLLVELVAENGAVVGQRLVAVRPETGEDYGTFEGEIPYTISVPTAVRLTIYERRDRIPGYTHVTSLEILLNP